MVHLFLGIEVPFKTCFFLRGFHKPLLMLAVSSPFCLFTLEISVFRLLDSVILIRAWKARKEYIMLLLGVLVWCGFKRPSPSPGSLK